jgi:hypothetical protein
MTFRQLQFILYENKLGLTYATFDSDFRKKYAVADTCVSSGDLNSAKQALFIKRSHTSNGTVGQIVFLT